MYTIYCHLNQNNGKRYIGQTKHNVQKRWQSHVKDALNESQFRFHRAIRSHALDAWKCEILEIVETQDEANQREMHWIAYFRSNDPNFGYNMTMGGEGIEMTEEIRDKLRQKTKLQWSDPDHKQKIAAATENFWSSDEGQEKKERLAERNRSEQARKSSSEAQKRRWTDPKQKEEMSRRHKNKFVSGETCDKIRNRMRELWSDPAYRQMMLEKRKSKKTSF